MKLQAKISLGMIGLYLATALATVLSIVTVTLRTVETQNRGTWKAVAESLVESYRSFVEYNSQFLAGYADMAAFINALERDSAARAAETRKIMADLLKTSPQLADIFIQRKGKVLLSAGGDVYTPPPSGTAFIRDAAGRVLLIIQRKLEGVDATLGFALSMTYFTQTHVTPMKISPRTSLFIVRLEDASLIVHTDPVMRVIPNMELREAFAGKRDIVSGLYGYRWGRNDKVAYVVVKDGFLFGISLFRTDLLEELYRAYRFLIGVSAASAMCFVAMALFIARSISRPVLSLAEAAGRIASRDYAVRVKLESRDEMELLGKAFNQMADDIQAFTGNLERLVAERTEALEQKMKQVEELSVTDPLTGIFNRKRFNEELTVEIERVKRYSGFLALIMFDIDHFKEINDAFGHAAGDAVLVDLTTLVGSLIRKADVFSRWGGEEFLILLPETDLDGAEKMAEKLRASIETRKFPGVPSVTCSFGVVSLTEIDDADTLFKRVDDALYEAKESGRNRVAVG